MQTPSVRCPLVLFLDWGTRIQASLIRLIRWKIWGNRIKAPESCWEVSWETTTTPRTTLDTVRYRQKQTIVTQPRVRVVSWWRNMPRSSVLVLFHRLWYGFHFCWAWQEDGMDGVESFPWHYANVYKVTWIIIVFLIKVRKRHKLHSSLIKGVFYSINVSFIEF